MRHWLSRSAPAVALMSCAIHAHAPEAQGLTDWQSMSLHERDYDAVIVSICGDVQYQSESNVICPATVPANLRTTENCLWLSIDNQQHGRDAAVPGALAIVTGTVLFRPSGPRGAFEGEIRVASRNAIARVNACPRATTPKALHRGTGSHSGMVAFPGAHEDLKITGSFWIDSSLVTVAQFMQCVAASKCEAPMRYELGAPFVGCEPPGVGRDVTPVLCITWKNASAYCDFVGKRVPTESELLLMASDQRVSGLGTQEEWTSSSFCAVSTGSECASFAKAARGSGDGSSFDRRFDGYTGLRQYQTNEHRSFRCAD
jgi:hypothetical protein